MFKLKRKSCKLLSSIILVAALLTVQSSGFFGASTGTYAAAEETTTQTAIGGLAGINWNVSDSRDIEKLSIDVSINEDIDQKLNLYICALAGKINNVGFYCGIQTNTYAFISKKNSTYRDPFRGALFSRWDETSLDAVSIGVNGSVQAEGYEGNFVGVRNYYQWNKGLYNIELKVLKSGFCIPQDNQNTWVGMFIYSYAAKTNTYIGAIRFPGTTLKLDSWWLNSFVELYSPTPVDQVPNRIIGYSNLRINDEIVKLGNVCAGYQKNTCNTGKAKITDTEVQVLTGPGVDDPSKYNYIYSEDRNSWYEDLDASHLKSSELVVKPDVTDNPAPIQAPENLKVKTDINNVYLSWKAPANAVESGLIGYYIYKVTSEGETSQVPINNQIIRDTSYVDKSVGKDKTLYYYVTSVNKYEIESGASDQVMVKTNSVTIPKDLKANITNNTVVLKWNMPVTSNAGDVLGYYVYRANSSDMKDAQKLNSTFITGTTFTDSSYKKDQAYFYAVKAVNKYGALSAFSSKASVNAELGRPVNLTAKSYDKKVILKWSAPEGSNPSKIKGYYIYRGTTSGNEALVPINKTLIIGNSYSNSSVTAGKTYYYVVKAVNINGVKSQASNEVKIKAVN